MNRKERRAIRKATPRSMRGTVDRHVVESQHPSGPNGYKCKECGGVIITRHVDNGTTPMFLACRATEGCTGQMVSMMYPAESMPPELESAPVFEWYRPEVDQLTTMAEVDYVQRGGLALRAAS